MNERENLGVGVYLFLMVGVVIFCLVGAFVLPTSITSSRILGCFGIGGLLVSPFLSILADRSRARNAVEDRDGILISMKSLRLRKIPGISRYHSFDKTLYQVFYVDITGATHRALCKSAWFSGVEWVEDEKVSEGTLLSEVE